MTPEQTQILGVVIWLVLTLIAALGVTLAALLCSRAVREQRDAAFEADLRRAVTASLSETTGETE